MALLGYLFTTDNVQIPLKTGTTTTSTTRGLVLAGVDATGVVRFVRVDTDGKIVVAP